MDSKFIEIAFERQSTYAHRHRPRSAHFGRIPGEAGFICKHCKLPVSSALFLSGVHNRNHCPYCLWSRHLDLYAAGDRLSACKSLMQPIGLTLKITRKRYGSVLGELMLIHVCIECQSISINRIAADDDFWTVLAVFDDTSGVEATLRAKMNTQGIQALDAKDRNIVLIQLFGSSKPVSVRAG